MPAPYERFQADWFRLDGKAAAMTGANQNLDIAYAAAFARAGVACKRTPPAYVSGKPFCGAIPQSRFSLTYVRAFRRGKQDFGKD